MGSYGDFCGRNPFDQAKGKDVPKPGLETLGHTFRFSLGGSESGGNPSETGFNVTKPRWWFQTTGYFLWSLAIAMSY